MEIIIHKKGVMSIINDDPNVQASADASRGIAPIVSGNPIQINVRKEESDGPSMPEGGLKPLSEPKEPVDIEGALADNTPGTASFEGPKVEKDLSDFSQIDPVADFIEAPVEELQEAPKQEEQPAEKPAGKSIDIVDKTPEAEDLINGPDTNNENTDNNNEVVEENHVELQVPSEQNQEAPVVNNTDFNIDPEHAFEESNEDFFRMTREKIANLRKERNECTVAADKKEDELVTVQRYNSQYEVAGAYDKVDRERVESLRNEIRDLRAQAEGKDKVLRSALKTLTTL